MFRSRVKQRHVFSRRRRVRRGLSWWGAIASVGLLLLSLELLTRILIDLSGERSKFEQVKVEPTPVDAYKLDFLASSAAEQPSNQDSLLAKNSMAVGYSLVANQENQFWQINPQGFRDREPVPLIKPQDEVRIFLLGSSTAFGYGSPNNSTTISAQLETRLQQRLRQQQTSPQLYQPKVLPKDQVEQQKYLAKTPQIKPGNYRIINAAVPGYTSGNELAQVALQILKYKPDLIVILDGYQDLLLSSDRQGTEISPSKITPDRQSHTVGTYIDQLLEPLQNNSYLAKIVANNLNSSVPQDVAADFVLDEKLSNLVQYLPQNEQELQARVARYIDHQKQMLNLSAASKVPLIVAIQPEITGRNPRQLTATEGKIATELGRTYIRRVRNSYPAFTAASLKLAKAYPHNLKVIDLYKLTNKYPSPSFLDAIHLNEVANQKVAEQLYYAIASTPKMQVKPRELSN